MTTPLQRLLCPHRVTTEHDKNGDAICLRCGAVVEVRLNIERLREAMRRML